MRLATFRFTFLIALLSMALGAVAHPNSPQRRSRSRSSGSVRVRGYTRKDGTYVQPHYRSRPNGTVTDNFSFQGNTNPFTGLIGTKDYPHGVWVDPSDRTRTFNTPFLGLTADYEADGLVVKDVSSTRKIKKGWRVASYRLGKSGSFIPAESWTLLTAAAMDSEESKIVLRGTDGDGKEFTEEVAVLGPTEYYGAPNLDMGRGYFVGTVHEVGPVAATITSAEADCGLEAGMMLDGIRLTTQKELTPVKTWEDVERFLRANPAECVIVHGTKKMGSAFTLVANVSKARFPK